MNPAIGRVKRATATGTAAVVALVGLVTTSHVAQAGAPLTWSGVCTDNKGGEAAEVGPIVLPGGATLSFEVGTGGVQGQLLPNLENVHLVICFSDTSPGTPSNLAGGAISIDGPRLGLGSPHPILSAVCRNDPNVVIQPQCAIGLDAVITPTYGPCGNITCGATVTVAVPVQVCAGLDVGVHQVGYQCPYAVSGITATTGLGTTGLIITSFGLNGGPGGSIGIVSTLWVDGISLPIDAGV